MKLFNRVSSTAVALLSFTMLQIPASAHAQSMTLRPPSDRAVSLETAHTFFKEGEQSLGTLAFFLDGRYSIGQPILLLEVPFGNVSGDFNSASGVGGIYLGAEMPWTPTSRTSVEFGVRLPNATDQSLFPLSFTDLDRIEAFQDLTTFRAVIHHRPKAPGLNVGFHGGLLHSRGEDDFSRTHLAYGLDAVSTGPSLNAGAGVIGRFVLSGSGGSFGERSVHFLHGWADFGSGDLRPGITAQLPVDKEFRDVMRATIGVRLQMVLH